MKLLPQKVVLDLINPKDKKSGFKLTMDLYDLPITHRWLGEFSKNISNKHFLEKHFCFIGFMNSHRDVAFLCDQLNKAVATINEFNKTGTWPVPYYIDMHFSPETVLKDGELVQEVMNDLHHHFSMLNGQVWNVSEYLKAAPFDIRLAIGRLNHLCHELESFADCFKLVRKWGPEVLNPAILCGFTEAPRFDLHDEDYDSFEFHQYFGGVYLHYCQVGKRWDEAFDDRDNVASSEEISGLRYYSGEFNVVWGTPDPEWFKKRKEEIHNWLISIGKDPNDKRLSLGYIHVGRFDREQNFGDRKLSEIHDVLAIHSDISKISVIDENGAAVVQAEYPITNLDDEYDFEHKLALKKRWFNENNF